VPVDPVKAFPLINLIVLLGRSRRHSLGRSTMMVMKLKGMFIRSCRIIWRLERLLEASVGRPEGPNSYDTLAKLKAMVRISKSRLPPTPPHPHNPDLEESS
jgi:hypothetical protein